jgi:hydroxymethylpyrimidine/phosphomethylpyrimidine kinase
MNRGPPTVLTVAGSDSSGGAGIQADLRAFAVVGVHGACALTAVTAQNSRGVRDVLPLAPRAVEVQIDAVTQDMGPRWAKTGMLFSAEVARAVAGRLAEYTIASVVDPITVATSGEALSSKGLMEAIRQDLIPHAELVTPNIEEASELLRDRNIFTVEDFKRAAEDLRELGPKAVLVKGGHLEGSLEVVDVLCTASGHFEEFRHPRLKGTFHGTGCTLSALIAGYLAQGMPISRAVGRAERMLQSALASAYIVGGGALFLDHMAPARMAALRWEVAREVRLAARQLELALDGEWLPEIGSNIAFALPGATTADDIAALTGRIHRVCNHARTLGHVNFGASKYLSLVVLAAMRHDPSVRAVVNISRTEDHIRRAKEAGLSVASFKREDEPAHAPKEWEWGTDSAIEAFGTVPDVIEDAGGERHEPVMRVLGKEPAEVVDKIRRIAAKE